MSDNYDRGRNARETEVEIHEAAETPRRVSDVLGEPVTAPARNLGEAGGSDREQGFADRGGAELHLEEPEEGSDTIPPPSAHRADRIVRAVGPDARKEMERGNRDRNEPSFTKGDNAPTSDQTRLPYTVEQMDEYLREAPRGIFPDTPGGDGATPLSADRNDFLNDMGRRGRFPSQDETVKWARAVFNALRQHGIEKDDAIATEFAAVVRVGEAPEVQVEEMMWGGDFIDRMSRVLAVAGDWNKQAFYEQVAEEAGATSDDPWVDASVYSFIGTLKAYLDGDSNRVGKLGDLQSIWDNA
jgi:hypothetical protein